MKINWFSYYIDTTGYGRCSSRLVRSLQTFGIDVLHLSEADLVRPKWMWDQLGLDWSNLTITCNQPNLIKKVPGRHWIFTMCEGTKLPKSLIDKLNKIGAERLLVPCEHNREVFASSGYRFPISVVPLGTDPEEFPLITDTTDRPYTFLTIADRGNRKGWSEVFDAFYKGFGGKNSGDQDVRLIVKCFDRSNSLIELITRKGTDLDPRVTYLKSSYPNMADLYRLADCLVLPSRGEGWGMPHREAAMMGLPVITQKYSGVDDGHTEEWAICIKGGRMVDIPSKNARIGGSGKWMISDIDALAKEMRWCYSFPDVAKEVGKLARGWLSTHQTWMDSAAEMINLFYDEGLGDYANIRHQVEYPTYEDDRRSGTGIPVYDVNIGEERSLQNGKGNR